MLGIYMNDISTKIVSLCKVHPLPIQSSLKYHITSLHLFTLVKKKMKYEKEEVKFEPRSGLMYFGT